MARLIRGPDARSILWLSVVAIAYLSPALWNGPSFGPFDLGNAVSGLGTSVGHPHNWLVGDQIQELIPWNYFDWQQIRTWSLPLWNPYVGLGLPQMFNFQSGVLSLPNIISYMVPARFAFIVAVFVKLLLAGTGVYLFARAVGIELTGCVFAATVYELSGAFANEVGWPISDVMAWMGWVFASIYILYTRPRAKAYIALLAGSVAFAVYGGFPEADVLIALTAAIFFGSLWARDILVHRTLPWNRLLHIAIGILGGASLSAPLWMPGVQLINNSARIGNHPPSLPLHALLAWVFQGFWGLPLFSSQWFGPVNYYETVAYLGIIGLVLACTSLKLIRTRKEILPLWITAGILLAIAYQWGFPQAIIHALPLLNTVALGRARLSLAFALSIPGFIQTPIFNGVRTYETPNSRAIRDEVIDGTKTGFGTTLSPVALFHAVKYVRGTMGS